MGNVGVYMIYDETTGASYVGSSRNLLSRVNYQLVAARRGNGFYGEFDSSKPENIKACILEYVEEPETERQFSDLRCGLQSGPVKDREKYWIRKLQPTANRLHKTESAPLVQSLSELSVGLPEAFSD